MNAKRFWLEIVAVATGIACALALLIATLGVGAVAVTGGAESAQSVLTSVALLQSDTTALHQRTYEGMVTCSTCGAKHAASLGKSPSDCTRQCVHFGATFALVDGDKMYTLEGDSSLLKRIAGQRASILGVLSGNTIKVLSVATAT